MKPQAWCPLVQEEGVPREGTHERLDMGLEEEVVPCLRGLVAPEAQ